MFHSDAGIRLQRRDADMAEKIMRRLVGHGIVVLPIQDSFITAKSIKTATQCTLDYVGRGRPIISAYGVHNDHDQLF